jgi:CheY-like chemotaxis protein
MPSNDPPDPARPLVLLVTEEADTRRALQLLLRGSGFEVRAYASGWRLLSDTALHQARCLVADDRMSDMDGPSLLRLMHASGWNGRALLIANSGADHPLGDFAAVLGRSSLQSRLVACITRIIGPKLDPAHST